MAVPVFSDPVSVLNPFNVYRGWVYLYIHEFIRDNTIGFRLPQPRLPEPRPVHMHAVCRLATKTHQSINVHDVIDVPENPFQPTHK